MKSLCYSVVAVIGLVGCAAAPDLPSTYVLDASQTEGLLIGSLTLSGRRLDRISAFRFRLREIASAGEEFAVVRPYHASLRQQTFTLQSGNLDKRLTGHGQLHRSLEFAFGSTQYPAGFTPGHAL
jgi:hypothetical protein